VRVCQVYVGVAHFDAGATVGAVGDQQHFIDAARIEQCR
jgi:hypothetical protein